MTPPTEEIKPLSNTGIAETYLEAIRAKDLSKTLFAPNITLQFPVSSIEIVGRENVNEYLAS